MWVSCQWFYIHTSICLSIPGRILKDGCGCSITSIIIHISTYTKHTHTYTSYISAYRFVYFPEIVFFFLYLLASVWFWLYFCRLQVSLNFEQHYFFSSAVVIWALWRFGVFILLFHIYIFFWFAQHHVVNPKSMHHFFSGFFRLYVCMARVWGQETACVDRYFNSIQFVL